MHLSVYHDETYELLEYFSFAFITFSFLHSPFFPLASFIHSVSFFVFLFSFCNSLSWSETRQMARIHCGQCLRNAFFMPLSSSQTQQASLFTVSLTRTHSRPACFFFCIINRDWCREPVQTEVSHANELSCSFLKWGMCAEEFVDPESHLAKPLVRELMRGSGEAGAAQGPLRNTECSSCLFEAARLAASLITLNSNIHLIKEPELKVKWDSGFYWAVCCCYSEKPLTLDMLYVFFFF